MRLIRTLSLAALAAAAFLVAAPGEASAGDRHWRHGQGWDHPGDGWGPPPRHAYAPPPAYHYYYVPPPRVYYAPPRVYVAPPPVYYAPPPVYYAPAPGLSLNFRF